MRKRSRLMSVALSHLALIVGLCALPTLGQSQTTFPSLNWTPPIDFAGGSPASFPVGTTATSLITTGTIPMWAGSDTFNSVTYNFSMVGKDPNPATGTSGKTTVTTRIIPIKFISSTDPSVVIDPENNDACSPGKTPALNMVQQSPLFFKSTVLPGNLSTVGTGQLTSLYQRANFSTFTAKGGVSPSYGVDLQQSLDNTGEKKKNFVDIATVDLGATPVAKDTNMCAPLLQIEVNKWDTYLRSTFFPALPHGAGPKELLIFLFTNVVMYDNNTSNCCILSYHGAFPSQVTPVSENGQLQTYIVTNYDSTNGQNLAGAFPTAPDLVATVNAIAGWMDNPTTLNPTVPWTGTINGTTGCQDVLEVAFPPDLNVPPQTTITLHKVDTYHVPDLAFKSWFYQDTGSANTGFNGQYSLFNTLTLLPPC
jgi:hypothetical protein